MQRLDSNLNVLLSCKKGTMAYNVSKQNCHVNTLFYKLKTLNIFYMYKLQIVLFVYNSCNHSCPMELKNFYNHFRFCEVQNNCGTRSVGSLLVPAFLLTFECVVYYAVVQRFGTLCQVN